MSVKPPGDTVTGRLCDYAAHLKYEDLPADVQHEGRRSFLNILGCALGGAHHPSTEIVARVHQSPRHQDRATLIGRGAYSDANSAALINCLSSCVYNFDDTHAESVVHPSGPAASAALAIAEPRHIGGREFLTAFVLGVETICRVSKAISTAPAVENIAWAQTSLCGGFGAAIAAGKLLNLDSEGLGTALSIVAIHTGGIRVAQGSTINALLPAFSAQIGVQAALLVEAGFSGGVDALGGRMGFLETFSSASHAPWISSDLGERYEIRSNTYKPFPCGVVVTPVIQACLDLKRQHDVAAEAISQIRISLNPKAILMSGRPDPQNRSAAQLSFQHWAAVCLLYGEASLSHLSEDVIRSTNIVRLRAKIVGVPADDLDLESTNVTLIMDSGGELTSAIRSCVGSREHPMTDADLEAKFRNLAFGVISDRSLGRLIDQCWQLDAVSDIGQVMEEAWGHQNQA